MSVASEAFPVTDSDQPVHTLPGDEVCAAFGTNPDGLTQSDAIERQCRFGPNTIREIRGKPLVVKLLANFTHLMAVLLWIGGLIGFLAQMPQLGLAIWLVVLINGVFSFWQE